MISRQQTLRGERSDMFRPRIGHSSAHSKLRRQCTYNVILRRVRELLLPCKSNKYYIFVCVCVCVCARSPANVHVPGRMGVCMQVLACSLAYPARKSYIPYCDVICGPSGSTSFFDLIS